MPSPNIAVVVLDTLRKDSFEADFEWLAKKSATFDNAWSTSHWTVPAHASLFTGRYASEVGTHAKNRHLPTELPTLTELLGSHGYHSEGLTANASIGPELGFARGFDEYRTIGPDSAITKHTPSDKDGVSKYLWFVKNVVESDNPTLSTLCGAAVEKWPGLPLVDGSDDGATEALEYVTNREFSSGEFLFLNLMETHSPYSPPSQYLSEGPARLTSFSATVEEPEQDEDHIRQAYDDATRYLSGIYQEIHDELTNDFDIIITLSDHGEALGERGHWGHSCVLSPEITHIPLAVWDATDEIESTDQPVSLLDIFQTVLDIADADRPDGSRGQSLVTEAAGDSCRFVETHGLTEQEVEMLTQFDDPDLVKNTYGPTRHAVVTATDYAYETIDEGLETQGEVDNAEMMIQEFVDEREMAEVRRREVPESVEQQLEHLGYA